MLPLSRSETFAFLIPVSIDATAVLKLRANRALLAVTASLNYLPPYTYLSGAESSNVVKLDCALLFGRHCLAFGSSRCNELQLPKAAAINASHFVLRFEIHTGV